MRKSKKVKINIAELLKYPLALQRAYIAKKSNVDWNTKMEFTLLEMIEILQAYDLYYDKSERMESSRDYLLTHSGRVEHGNEVFSKW